MIALLIDTCGLTGSVGLADTERGWLATETLPGRAAAERLVSTVRALLSSSGVTAKTIGVVVVVNGPGSFTGVRVGVSAAKGLCEALGVPMLAISRLALLASSALPDRAAAERARVVAVLDAGRGEFYCGEYADGVFLREALMSRDELVAVAEGAAGVVPCEAAVAAELAAWDCPWSPLLVAEPTVEDAWPLALMRIEAGSFDDVVRVDANYVRRTDAEIFAKPTEAKPPAAKPAAVQAGGASRE